MKNTIWKRMAAAAVAGCLSLTLASCGGQTASSTAASAAAGSSSSEAASSESASETAETTGSGKVVVYMPSPAGLADKIAAAFTEKTGIEVEQFQGTTGEILARLETEQANPVADVVILASWSDGLSMKADDQIISYTPANADKINDGWIDEDSMLFGYSASAVGVIYNTTIYHVRFPSFLYFNSAFFEIQLLLLHPLSFLLRSQYYLFRGRCESSPLHTAHLCR